MKKIFLFLLPVLIFYSCRPFPINIDPSKAKNPEYKAYLKTRDGEIVAGDAVERQSKFLKQPTITVSDRTFKTKEISEYQDISGLYINTGSGFVQALTGPRLITYVETYSTTMMTSSGRERSTHVIYRLRKTGEPQPLIIQMNTMSKLGEWVQDNPEAYEQIDLAKKAKKSLRFNQLINWGALIGGVALITSSPVTAGSKKAAPAELAGTALFGGALINIGINMFHRRPKIGHAYANAINIYNEAPPKKKK